MKAIVKIFSILVMTALVLSLSICAGTVSAQAENTAVTEDENDINAQLNLIFSNVTVLKQDESRIKWYYSVTDLNHNGRLEFVAASQHPEDRSTNLKVWEVKEDRTGLTEFTLNKDPEESFPDIMTDSADTFHDTATGTWSYLCYDNVVLSPTEVYTVKCSVNIGDGEIGYDSYAVEHTKVSNGMRSVSHTDSMGFSISAEQYNAAGANAFAGAERSNTSFDWFTVADADKLARLTDSYLVFSGQKEPTEVFPVPKPEALQTETPNPAVTPNPTVTPNPAATPIQIVTPTPTPAPAPTYLTITKNPTNENNRKVGGKATFVACANTFESLSWTFVSPNGGEYTPWNFISGSGATVGGENSTTITVNNLESWMDGWGAYCTFYYKGQTARTSTAYIYVSGGSQPTPTPAPVYPTPSQTGSFNGYVADYGFSTLTLYLYDGPGYTTEVSFNICSISGNLYVGAPCTAYYDGISVRGPIITYVTITGEPDKPVVNYGSMSGSAYNDSQGSLCIFLQNGDTVYVSKSICNIRGYVYAAGGGCNCTVYYTDYPSEKNIYSVDVYGYDVPEDAWNDGSNGGWAGSNYYENEWGYDSEDTYWTDDTGDGWDGGWAGSNYYENEWGYDSEGTYWTDDTGDGWDGGWAGSNYYG